MPVYSFWCKACEAEIDYVMPLDFGEAVCCPVCGETLRRQYKVMFNRDNIRAAKEIR